MAGDIGASRLIARVEETEVNIGTSGASHRTQSRPWWALAAIVLAALTVGFDITILNVALPTMAAALGAGTSGLQWIVNAYLLVLAGLMLTAGALGDRYGRKKLLITGLALFGAASAAAAWSDTTGQVIAARAVMGAGAAIILPVAFAVLPAIFGPAEQARAVSLVVVGTGAGIPLGPLIGGWLLQHFSWGSIFLVNVPMAVIAIAALTVLLPETRDPQPRPPDVPGAVLSTAGLAALTWGLIEAPARGWDDRAVIAGLTAGAALIAGFAWQELHTRTPMIDLRLFARPQFLWGSITGVLVSFGLLGMLFVVPQYLQLVIGHDALATGIRLLPMIGGLVAGAAIGERLAARAGYRTACGTGLAILAAGLTIGATTGIDTSYALVAAWLAVVGMGTGLALSPAMDAVLGALPAERSGAGTAITMTLRQAGGALGVAVLGSILAAGYASHLDTTGLPPAVADAADDSIAAAVTLADRLGQPALATSAKAAYLHGMSLVLATTAVIAAVSAIAVFALLTGRPRLAANSGERPGTPEHGSR